MFEGAPNASRNRFALIRASLQYTPMGSEDPDTHCDPNVVTYPSVKFRADRSKHLWQHEVQRQCYLGLKDGQPHTSGHHKSMVSPSKISQEWKTLGSGKYVK
jgi:hypothetical protein